jgi:hypothetical protein
MTHAGNWGEAVLLLNSYLMSWSTPQATEMVEG